jgi:hypothetical protein
MSRGVEFGYLEEESMATNSTLVRVNKDVLATLHQLSEQQGLPMQEIVFPPQTHDIGSWFHPRVVASSLSMISSGVLGWWPSHTHRFRTR